MTLERQELTITSIADRLRCSQPDIDVNDGVTAEKTAPALSPRGSVDPPAGLCKRPAIRNNQRVAELDRLIISVKDMTYVK
jgi:hypothetical protein